MVRKPTVSTFDDDGQWTCICARLKLNQDRSWLRKVLRPTRHILGHFGDGRVTKASASIIAAASPTVCAVLISECVTTVDNSDLSINDKHVTEELYAGKVTACKLAFLYVHLSLGFLMLSREFLALDRGNLGK